MPGSFSNRLLASLPQSPQKKIREQGISVSLPIGRVLYRSHSRPQFAHFLTSGISSLVVTMSDGHATEVGLVGMEGLPQAVHLLGPLGHPAKCVMQTRGSAIQIDLEVLARILHSAPQAERSLLAYLQFQALTAAQLAACNRRHSVQRRLARWLLMIHDQTNASVLRLTQNYLSSMVGTQRTTVSEVASALQERGLISYSRGVIRITDVEGLRGASCECYGVVRLLLKELIANSYNQVCYKDHRFPASLTA